MNPIHLSAAFYSKDIYTKELVYSNRETDIFRYPSSYGVDFLAVRGTEFSESLIFNWSFEGLKNCWDIGRDLFFTPWRCPITGVWGHAGFMLGAYNWFLEFAATLDKSRMYVVTGHSLGAAIAPHLARYLAMHHFSIAEVVLFGEPAGHYWRSRKHYASLGIPTTSYRVKNDWIRFAGFGRRTVKPTILPAHPSGKWAAHNIDWYIRKLEKEILWNGLT